MVPRIHAGGRSFGGVVQYLTHDAAIPGDRHPKTGERVGWYVVENLPDCEPREAAAMMRGTARDAAVLKVLAGVSAKGRPLTKPVYHYSLSWAPDEKPATVEMVTAARSSLQALGMADRQAFIVQHTDRAHAHCHIVVNRVSPEDGRAASDSHSKRALSAWARTWERERGGIRCPGRPVPPVERTVAVLKHIWTKNELPPPPPRPQPRRGPGRDGRDRQDRQAWAALYARQRRDALKTQVSGPRVKRSRHPQHRLERRDLAQQQLATREQERVLSHLSRRPHVEWETSTYRWRHVTREDAAAPPVERRLPHVGGVLAVSDQTFARLAHSHYVDAYPGGALASIHLDHLAKKDGFQRAQAESQYFVSDDAIATEQRQQAATNASEYRAGRRHTPHAPSWKEATAMVVSNIYERVCDVIKQLYREARERGGYEIEPTIADRTRNQFAKDMERIRAEREREEERERGRDPDFGPSR